MRPSWRKKVEEGVLRVASRDGVTELEEGAGTWANTIFRQRSHRWHLAQWRLAAHGAEHAEQRQGAMVRKGRETELAFSSHPHKG
jgi:hypothetical protein